MAQFFSGQGRGKGEGNGVLFGAPSEGVVMRRGLLGFKRIQLFFYIATLKQQHSAIS